MSKRKKKQEMKVGYKNFKLSLMFILQANKPVLGWYLNFEYWHYLGW